MWTLLVGIVLVYCCKGGVSQVQTIDTTNTAIVNTGTRYIDQCRERWDFPNPCIPDNLLNKRVRFIHPYDNTKFLLCDDFGKLYVVQCPQNEIFSEGCNQCISLSAAVSATCELPVEVVLPTRNPCTVENILANRLYFPYPGDLTKFIHCDIWGKPWVRTCNLGEIWSPWDRACVVPKNMNPCERPGIDLSLLYRHPCDMSKFIVCDASGIAYVVDCGLDRIFNEVFQRCMYRIDYNGTIFDPYCGVFTFGFEPFTGTAEEAALQLGSESMRIALQKTTDVRMKQGPGESFTKVTDIRVIRQPSDATVVGGLGNIATGDPALVDMISGTATGPLVDTVGLTTGGVPDVIYTDATGTAGTVSTTRQVTTKLTDIRSGPTVLDSANLVDIRSPTHGTSMKNVRQPTVGDVTRQTTRMTDIRTGPAGTVRDTTRHTSTKVTDIRTDHGGVIGDATRHSTTKVTDIRTGHGGVIGDTTRHTSTKVTDIRTGTVGDNLIDIRTPGGLTGEAATTFVDLRTPADVASNLVDVRNPVGTNFVDVRGPIGNTATTFVDVRGTSTGPDVVDIRTPIGPDFVDVRPTGTNFVDVRTTGPEFIDVRSTGPEFVDVRSTGPEFVDVRTTGQEFVDVRTTGPDFVDVRTTGPEFVDVRRAGPDFVDVRTPMGPEFVDVRTTGPDFIDIRGPLTGVGSDVVDIRPSVETVSNVVDIRNPIGAAATNMIDVRTPLTDTGAGLMDIRTPVQTTGITRQSTTRVTDIRTQGDVGGVGDGTRTATFIDVRGNPEGTVRETTRQTTTNLVDVRNPTGTFTDIRGVGDATLLGATRFVDVRNPGAVIDSAARTSTNFVDEGGPTGGTRHSSTTDIRTVGTGSNLLTENTGSFLGERQDLSLHGRGPDLGTTGLGVSDFSGRQRTTTTVTETGAFGGGIGHGGLGGSGVLVHGTDGVISAHGNDAGMHLTNPLSATKTTKTTTVIRNTGTGQNQFDLNNMLVTDPGTHSGFRTTDIRRTTNPLTGILSGANANAQLLANPNRITLENPVRVGMHYKYGDRPWNTGRWRDGAAQQRVATRTVTVRDGGNADLSSMSSILGNWRDVTGSGERSRLARLRGLTLHPSQMKAYGYSTIPYSEPCTPENIGDGRMYFRYIRDPHRFIQCDETGTMHLRICSTFGRDWFDIYSNTCVDGPIHVDDKVAHTG